MTNLRHRGRPTGPTSSATARSTVGVRRSKREQVETVDGRIYSTEDGWETVCIERRGKRGKVVVVDKEEADLARYLAIYQSTSEGGRS